MPYPAAHTCIASIWEYPPYQIQPPQELKLIAIPLTL